MPAALPGQIVWHDLFTDDVAAARAFYADRAGWTYVTEEAADFAWRGGGPGVGRNALLRDPQGAFLGLAFSRQFGPEHLLAPAPSAARASNAALLPWKQDKAELHIAATGSLAALVETTGRDAAVWCPALRTGAEGRLSMTADPDGTAVLLPDPA